MRQAGTASRRRRAYVVPPLGPGGAIGFTFDVTVTAAPGNVINAIAIVDPSNFMAELNKSNNTDNANIFVGAAIVGPTFTPTPASCHGHPGRDRRHAGPHG